MSKAILLLEDGKVFEGTSFGAQEEAVGQVVFNTAVVGYQEIITDPTYCSQIVCFSYPLIGNYGINDKSFESPSVQVSAIIVKENSKIFSNWQATGSLSDFMLKNKLVGIEELDTRALVVHIRDNGEKWAIISTKDFDKNSLLKKIESAKNKKDKLISRVTARKVETLPATSNPGIAKHRIAMLDLGTNNSLLKSLKDHGFEVVRMPASSKAEDILKHEPEGILLSSGPGSPLDLPEIVSEVKKLLGKNPVFGTGLGHLVLGLALGAKVAKMKCGHHGVNHPVKHVSTEKGYITFQAHDWIVESVDNKTAEITYTNVNDNTIEGIKSLEHAAASIQFIPFNFDEFLGMMRS